MIPELNTSAANTVPCGWGTLEYARSMTSDPDWKSISAPFVPAASRLTNALTVFAKCDWVEKRWDAFGWRERGWSANPGFLAQQRR